MSDTAEQRWIWPLNPLSPRSWGNIRYPSEAAASGQTIEVHRAQGMLGGVFQMVYLFPGEERPSPFMGTLRQRFYPPTDADLEIVRTNYPDNDDPACPPWARIESDLIAAGRAREDLVKLNAPTLLRLLVTNGDRASSEKRRGRPRARVSEATHKRIVDAWGTHQHRTYAECARVLGVSVIEVRRALGRERKRRASE